jgi:hypothetical protein
MNERQQAVAQALGSLRLENIEPSPELVDELDRWAAGAESVDALDLIARRIVEGVAGHTRSPQAA